MSRKIIIAAVLAACLAAPAAASATTVRAHARNVTATLSYRGSFPNFRSEKLSISRAGKALYSRPVVSSFCGRGCALSSTRSAPAVQVVDLNGDGTPEVLLNLYSGGAHCCYLAQVFSYDPGTMTYARVERNFGDPGYRLASLGGRGHREFVSADDAFAYAFTDFAASGMPIQILGFSGGRFTDVTRQNPKLVVADAAKWLKAFRSTARHGYADSVGVVAAWAADEYLLGKRASADRQLRSWAAAGRLKSSDGPGGAAFVAKLQTFLAKDGYTR
jgi:hypothetical protein